MYNKDKKATETYVNLIKKNFISEWSLLRKLIEQVKDYDINATDIYSTYFKYKGQTIPQEWWYKLIKNDNKIWYTNAWSEKVNFYLQTLFIYKQSTFIYTTPCYCILCCTSYWTVL